MGGKCGKKKLVLFFLSFWAIQRQNRTKTHFSTKKWKSTIFLALHGRRHLPEKIKLSITISLLFVIAVKIKNFIPSTIIPIRSIINQKSIQFVTECIVTDYFSVCCLKFFKSISIGTDNVREENQSNINVILIIFLFQKVMTCEK